MQNIVWKIVLIVAVLGLCVWSLYPPDQKIRKGKDLQGGTSLIYVISLPPDAPNKADLLNQTISVLKERVNPQGVLDISMQPLGLDRIEIVMPLPNDKVLALRKDYQDALKKLMAMSQIDEVGLDDALKFNQAVAKYGGGETGRSRQIEDLQKAHNDLQSAQSALADAKAAGLQGEDLNKLESAVADAEFRYEQLHGDVLKTSLDESRVVRALNLSTKKEVEKDPVTGKPVLDADGKEKPVDSPREVSLTSLKTEFPHLASMIDGVVKSYDTYQTNRTTLDDPEDLMRLLRGAGVLEFHIAVRENSAEGVNVQDMRRQLLEKGPDNTESSVAHWYPVNDLKQWYDATKPQQLAALEANPQAYFASRNGGLVAEKYEGQIYILLYSGPTNSMTHGGGSKWTVEGANNTVDNYGRAAVSFRLDDSGGVLMSKLTGPHVNQPMAIVLDNQVYSAPNLQSQIGKSGIIQGDFSRSEINYLIRVLAAGALEARLSDRPIAINTLGPSVGKDNLNRGLQACYWSVIAVALFMILYYFQAGLVAIFAVACNAIIIFGVMAMIQGTFTLPGLAGIALTIGTAVDANILIYERIREELERGEDLKTAIRLGYSKAFNSIIDANVTNLIVCVVLVQTATTEVKGFAMTMILGIVATLFTALFMTRIWYTIAIEVFGMRRMPMLATTVPAVKRFLEPNLDWIGLKKYFVPLSTVLVLTSWVLIFSRGANIFDTEFRGGISATMRPKAAPDGKGRVFLKQEDVERRIKQIGQNAAGSAGDSTDSQTKLVLSALQNAEVLTVGETKIDSADRLLTADGFQIKVSLPKEAAGNTTVSDIVVKAVTDEFAGDLDVTRKLTFTGAGTDAHATYTFPITSPELGANIQRPKYRDNVKEFMNGVAVVLDGISPPATIEDLSGRINRMRSQPDFRDTGGRKFRAYGLEPADPTDPTKGFKSVAVLVSDPAFNYSKVDFAAWDNRLAAREWQLASAALSSPPRLEQVSEFSSSVAQTLRANAIVATVLSLLGILAYIWMRFGSLRYSVGAIVALFHDASIGLGALALSQIIGSTAFGKALLLEEFHIDLEVVAAVLTLIGYSLNDTIVVLDRIRENRGKLQFPTAEMVNRSINQTFSRTTLTSLTMLISLLILYVAGGTGIRSFSFVMLVGMFVGTYSSIAIAAPLVTKGHDSPQPKPGSEAELPWKRREPQPISA